MMEPSMPLQNVFPATQPCQAASVPLGRLTTPWPEVSFCYFSLTQTSTQQTHTSAETVLKILRQSGSPLFLLSVIPPNSL